MKNGIVKILAVGDVVGKCGSEYIRKNLWRIRKEQDIDICLVNGENSAVGNGITKESAQLLFVSGADIITTGNHVFRRSEVYTYLDDCEKILRPANYPKGSYGFGHGVFDIGGVRILCMNLLGNVYMENMACPFECAKNILEREKGSYDIAICDIHAEATSEKLAFAYDFDGEINIVFGTHTHIQTNDAKVLQNGTGYITDLGMTGTEDSVLGVRKDIVIKKLKTKMPVRFEEAQGKAIFCGAVFEYDMNTKRVVKATTITERE